VSTEALPKFIANFLNYRKIKNPPTHKASAGEGGGKETIIEPPGGGYPEVN